MSLKAILTTFIAAVLCCSGHCEDGIVITSKITTHPVSSVVTRTVSFNSRFMKLSTDSNVYTLIDKSKAVAYVVNQKEKGITVYSKNTHNYFFNRFLVPYGILNENGDMIFSETIFKNNTQLESDGKYLFKIDLPGNFLGMRASHWFNKDSKDEFSALFRDYLSFFSDNMILLKQAEEIKRFPAKTEIHLTINGNPFSKTEETMSIHTANLPDSEFLLPENMEKTQPESF